MLYDIGQIDASGRIANRDIIGALGWQSGDRLEVSLTSGAIVIRACSDGHFSVPQRHRIIIPVTARRRHAIQSGDRVLLAAAPDYGIVIVFPLSTLNEMVANYHAAYSASEISRR